MSENIHYTYAYLDPRKEEKYYTEEFTFEYLPFYIGEGINLRMFDHLKDKKNTHKVNTIQQIINDGFQPIIIKIADKLTGDDALLLETSLIKQLGTRAIINGIPRGPLTNLKFNIGHKSIMAEEVKQKISESTKGIPKSQQTKDKMSLAQSNRSAETRTKLSVANKGKTLSIETRVKMSASKLGTILSADTREKMSLAAKGRSKSDETKSNMSKAQKGRITTTDVKDKISAAQRATWIVKFNNGDDTIIIHNLKLWCQENNINQSSLKNTVNRPLSFYNNMNLSKLDIHI